MELTSEIVFALLQSDNPFPIDFDDAMAWWDSRTRSGKLVSKGDLREKLESNFIEGVDYVLGFSEISEKPQGGRPRVIIHLTIECFKMMGMMLSGEVDEAKLYFGWKRKEKKYRMVNQ
jgi:hypothetical protein